MAAPNDIPPTMRAWTYSAAGTHRQVLKLNSIPSPKPPTGDQILIRVAYVGLNPGDRSIMETVPTLFRPKDSIPGGEFSGHVVALGPQAPKNLTPGMKVFGMPGTPLMFAGAGTLCEYICVSAGKIMIAPVPDNVSLEEAGAIACVANVAMTVCKKGGIKEGNGYKVLVNGASGGCGTGFVQVVLAMGAKEVVGTCSGPNEELVKSLGATQTIDYKAHTLLNEYLAKTYADSPFDFILDTIGDQSLYTHSPKYLKQDGVFVNIGGYKHGTLRTLSHGFSNSYWPKWLGGTPRKFIMFSASANQDNMGHIVRFLEEGKLKAVIDRYVPFEDALSGYDVVETKRARGRVVVKVQE